MEKFQFEKRCPNCALKNSTLIFPAKLLSNIGFQENEEDIYRCEKDEYPTYGSKEWDRL